MLATDVSARTSDIIQLAAVGEDGEEFNTYVMPKKIISAGASQVTGLYMVGGQLEHHGVAVPTVSITDALKQFTDFLHKYEKPVLVGHNIKSFDCPIITSHMQASKLSQKFSSNIYGFIDTLSVSKKIFKKEDVGNYRQETLVNVLLQKKYDSHNAIEDVKSLKLLFNEKMHLNLKDLSSFLFPLNLSAISNSLTPLVENKAISVQTRNKLACSSLSFKHLELAFKRDPEQGIAHIFREPTPYGPRITVSKSIIDKLNKYFLRP